MSTTPPTGPDGTPDPDGRGDPPGGPAPGTPDSSSRRVTRWLSSSYRWQGLLAALVAAVAGIVVAFISRDPQPPIAPPPTGPADVRSEAVVVTRSTRQDTDPASPPSGIAVTFEGTFSGLARDSRLFAMVLRGKDRADWPVALAELDWPHGTWRAVVRVAEPKLPLEYTTGVIPGVPKARPVASASGAAPPSAPPDDALERLRRDGPRAEGITGSAPFRPVGPGSGTASASTSASPQRRTG
ncbi:hypothetical protein ACWGEU_18940 [Streptomyces goshikiensis]